MSKTTTITSELFEEAVSVLIKEYGEHRKLSRQYESFQEEINDIENGNYFYESVDDLSEEVEQITILKSRCERLAKKIDESNERCEKAKDKVYSYVKRVDVIVESEKCALWFYKRMIGGIGVKILKKRPMNEYPNPRQSYPVESDYFND